MTYSTYSETRDLVEQLARERKTSSFTASKTSHRLPP